MKSRKAFYMLNFCKARARHNLLCRGCHWRESVGDFTLIGTKRSLVPESVLA